MEYDAGVYCYLYMKAPNENQVNFPRVIYGLLSYDHVDDNDDDYDNNEIMLFYCLYSRVSLNFCLSALSFVYSVIVWMILDTSSFAFTRHNHLCEKFN